ncbi:MAG: LysR family transcriptional regulator [Thiolinea sp.]
MIRYSLKQLSYFVAAAELQSTCAAARSLHVSQPSISAAIKQLEELFGQTLVVRHKGQGITPTPYGRDLLVRAKQLLSLADNLDNRHSDTASGSVLIGCFVDISPFYLPAILKALHQQFPDIRPRIINGELNEIPVMLQQGVLDIALTYGVLLEEGISYECLQTTTPHAMLPATHPLAALDAIPLESLLQEPFILSDAPYSSDFLLTVLNSLGLEPKIAYNAQTFELQRGMVANGLGVSLAYTRPLCSRSYDGRELVYRPLQEPLPSQDIVLARNSQLKLTPVTRAVWELIQALFAADREDPLPGHPAVQNGLH